ncbi:MAG: S9 family peptidase [Bryobacteraceae bacterium]
MLPPIAKVVPKPMSVHGDTRVDDYFWLRDRNDPDTIAYLKAENQHTAEKLRHTEPLQKQLYDEMLGRIQQTDAEVPLKREDYYYYARTEEGKQYQIFCRRHGSEDGPEEILLDGNVMGEGKEYFRVGSFAVSPNHKLLAYSVDFTGDETYTIRVKNLETGELLPDEIPNTYYTLEWANDNATFFYTVLDAALRPYQVWRHHLGAGENILVYHETDERFTVEINRTRSEAFVLICSDSPVTSEVRALDANDANGEFIPILPRVQDIEYEVTHHSDSSGPGTRPAGSWFIRTNDGAKTFRVVTAPVANPSKENWKEVLSAREGVTIESITAFREYMVTEERNKGLVEVRVRHLPTGAEHMIAFPEPAYSLEIGPMAEFDTKILRYRYTSLVTPMSVFDYDMETRAAELKKQQAVLGGYDPSQYQSERVYVTAASQPKADGAPGAPVQVPVSIVYKKGFVRNGQAPLLLYGYGSYGISIDATFAPERLSLLDRGWAFAIAHIRGGSDVGRLWQDDGKMLQKRHTFTDFIACAEYLIANKYTSPKRLAINGRSAGGLLMGAVINLRPDLFGAVVAGVPFVDSLNTALDSTLPLTIGEYEEFGNPADPKFYHYMKSYAPYENVEAKEYPAMLITAGLNDPRVSYWEPAKWTAKLRRMKTDDNILLLKTNMGSGHFGASGRYEHLKETALEYAFLLDLMKETA